MAKHLPSKVVADLRKSQEKRKLTPTVTLVGDGASAEVQRVCPTGLPTLDRWVLGIGGLAYGRMVEMFGGESAGKDTIMNRILAGAQKDGAIAALVDTEHKWDPAWAKLHGVNTEDLIWDRPDCLEDALATIEDLVHKSTEKVPIVIALNSVAGAGSRREVTDGITGDAAVAEQARLWSRFGRIIVGQLAKNHALLLCVNQTRALIGCFQYSTQVVLADGTHEKIGKIVNQRKAVEVLSFDATGKTTPRKVIGWHNNGKADAFLHVKVRGPGGLSQFSCTPEHRVFTPTGEVAASQLKAGDKVLSIGTKLLNPYQYEVALGSVLGDGSLRSRRGAVNVQLRIGHGPKQEAYSKWKAAIFGDAVTWSGRWGKAGWGFHVQPSIDLLTPFQESYGPAARTVSATVLKHMGLIGLSIWYMDDGNFSGSYAKTGSGKACISVKSYSFEEASKLQAWFCAVGLPQPSLRQGVLRWNSEGTDALHRALAPHIPPMMQYKIHPKYRGLFQAPQGVSALEVRQEMVPTPVVSIGVKSPTKSMVKFDLTVEGDPRYLVSGVGVHNSMYGPQLTTPGGNAVKFYSYLRLQVNHGKYEEGKLRRWVGVMASKNQVCPPMRSTKLMLDFQEGFLMHQEVMHHAKETGIVSAGCRSLKEACEGLGWADLLEGAKETVDPPATEETDEPLPPA